MRRPRRRRWPEPATCPATGKRCFRTEVAAKAALASTRSAGVGGDRRETRYYRCPDCGRYHLTSRP